MQTPEEAAKAVFHPPLDDPDRPDPSCTTDWYAYALRHAERVIRARDAEVAAKTWSEAVAAVAWATDRGPDPLRYVAETNPCEREAGESGADT